MKGLVRIVTRSAMRIAALLFTLIALAGCGRAHLALDLGGGVKMEFVLIRPGSFLMGSEKGINDEKPVHKVTITKPFYMGKYEVTQAQYEKVMGSNPFEPKKGANLPVQMVSWDDAQAFCRKISEKESQTVRLPTEAEWEYACRAGTTTDYYWGDAFDAQYAWCLQNSGNASHEVGALRPNAWGLYDMSGNVFEWCGDWYGDSYPTGDQVDPQGPSNGTDRVLRGGSWGEHAVYCRSSHRVGYRSANLKLGVGFRVCRVVSGR